MNPTSRGSTIGGDIRDIGDNSDASSLFLLLYFIAMVEFVALVELKVEGDGICKALTVRDKLERYCVAAELWYIDRRYLITSSYILLQVLQMHGLLKHLDSTYIRAIGWMHLNKFLKTQTSLI